MKESGKVSLYIAYFRSLISRIGDWGERAYIQVYRRGLESRLLYKLASHPGKSGSIQELMEITLKLDTRKLFLLSHCSYQLSIYSEPSRIHNSPPAKNTISQRHQAVLTPTTRAPLDCTPSVHQVSSNLDKGPPMEGAAPSKRGGVKSRRSRSFSGLLGGYQSISQGPRSRSGEAEDEEGGVCGRGGV
ncbi:hypothetical protein O181_025533 [Austropuccinia psidii MF-1]|uniref:Uncharacterized protein n=1 Tax=Austropuccinia psidii MF-1 TaxID=1389203 RepID=A0A9Q3CN02_9BASI|nr:hypothetical protein [Austropuccinia psidii MF-1]